jgi:hypothetical protein
VIEEYHKGLKTGCQIESPQFTSEDRLQPAIALISIVTLTLLNLRDMSRREDAKQRKATEVFNQDYVEVLSLWRHGKVRLDGTIHEFTWAMARLGGTKTERTTTHPVGKSSGGDGPNSKPCSVDSTPQNKPIDVGKPKR